MNRPTPLRSWTAAELETVRERWAAGDSAGLIAQSLPGRSRTAIIGIVNRRRWKRANGRRTPEHFVSRKRKDSALRQMLTVAAADAPAITLAGPVWSVPKGCRHVGGAA